MKKFIVNSSLLIVHCLFLLSITYYLLPIVYAADSTPSADTLRQSDSEASIRTKLEELKKEIASKAAILKQEVDRKLKNKAYVGKVKSYSDNSITIGANSGPKMVSINQDTVFESKIKGKSKFSAKTIREDDFIASLGDVDETGVLIARKIILLPTADNEPKINLWGQIISISDRLITLKDRDFKNVAVSLSKAVTLKLNDFVILTGVIDKNDIFSAGFVYTIPQGGILKPKKIGTPSAQPVTPSASVSTKIKVATSSAKRK